MRYLPGSGRAELAIVVVLLAGVAPALAAESEPTPITLVYDAPDECPTVRDLAARIAVRVPVTVVWEIAASRARVEARIAEQEGAIVGRLLVDQGGSTTEREVVGDTCEEVVSALALIAAVSLDVPELKSDAPAAPVSIPRETSAPVAPPRVVGSSTPAPAPEPPRASVDVLAGAGIKTAVAPDTVVGFHSRVRLVAVDPPVRAVAIGFTTVESDSFPTRAGTARFHLFAGELRACPWLWSPGPLQIGPCAVLELGGLRGTGHATDRPTSQTSWWVSPGLNLDWRARLGPLVFAASAGPGFPVVRDRFYFELKGDGWSERILAHRSPPVDWRAEMLLGVSLPQ